MRLYRARVPAIAQAVIERLTADGDIEVSPENRSEAEQDLVAIMETYIDRDIQLRNAVRDRMAAQSIPYDQYAKVRAEIAEAWGHPTGDSARKYLARQFVENFMLSRFVDEVYADDDVLFRKVIEILRQHDVDERALREEARARLKNVREGTVDYEIAFAQALREVKRRHGLIQ